MIRTTTSQFIDTAKHIQKKVARINENVKLKLECLECQNPKIKWQVKIIWIWINFEPQIERIDKVHLCGENWRGL